MKVTNRTAYATIGCDVQLSENDRLALGVELDKITNWLGTFTSAESETESFKAVNNIVAFVSKFAIRPSLSNVFTYDSIEEFKKVDETVTTDEPSPEDNIVTVNISNCKNMMNLIKIIYCATGESLANISKSLHKVKEEHISCISFKCTDASKEKVLSWLMGDGYTIAPNTAKSSQLESYITDLNDHE